MASSISTVSQNIDVLRRQSEMAISSLYAKVVALQNEQEEIIPKKIKDWMKKEIEDWKMKDTKFVPTRSSVYVSNCIQKQSCVTLTGSSGVGKTFVARHIALNLQSNGYRIVPVLTSTDIKDYYAPGKQTVFLVDDICGKFTISQTQLENWQQMLPIIKIILKDKCCKIISTCRLQVYIDDKFRLLEPFRICECNLISKEMCLTQLERTTIKKMYKVNGNFDDNLQVSDCFPLLCSLQCLPVNKFRDYTKFFRNPFDFYKDELDNLNRSDVGGKHKICGLLLCVLSNNKIQEKWFEGRVTDEQRQILDDVYAACRLNISTPKTEIKDALETLDGSLVMKRNAKYSVVHDKIFDFMAHYFGGRMIRCLIDHSDSYFISDRFRWTKLKNFNTSVIEFSINLTDDYFGLYLERLVNEWSVGRMTVVFINNNMKYTLFREQLLLHLQKHDKMQRVKLANTKDTFEIKGWGTSGSYPMLHACYYGYIDIAHWLLDNAVDVNQCRDDGNTSLFMACYNGHKNIVSLLLERNVSINKCNEKGITPLFIACEKGYSEIVNLLLASNADINISMKDEVNSISPLLKATLLNHIDIVKKLLKKNPDVNFSEKDGFTPLIFACQNNYTDMARLLIYNKSNVDMKTITGATAILLAAANGNIEITRLLLEFNADCNVQLYSKEMVSFRMLSCPWTTLTNVKLFIFNFTIERGVPSVQQYARLKSVDYIFDIMAGSSPLHIACAMGHLEIVKYLLLYNASVNLTKDDGTTPLFYACELGHDSIVRLLLDTEADITICRDDGRSPLAIAKENGHKNIEMTLGDTVLYFRGNQ
ncbi:uncharacterized protein LOC127710592 [Mytilus californianus]|uniref:uncharacterized protein LOC127710592 n=1 Tax=Mytilus californianus TaxID=6549 RepID=UPI00224675A3|nr:uncharacterized protein LOC127710592 [Mytilus californianus]